MLDKVKPYMRALKLDRAAAKALPRAPKTHEQQQAAYPETAILGLKGYQLYPNKEKLRPDFFKYARHELLTKQTPIASMGSCFAREVKEYLVENGYNYVQTATGPNARHASAAWDRVYNTQCIRQEFERALDTFSPMERYWQRENGELMDPYRKAVRWANHDAMENELAEHKRTAALALTTAEVVILTIGVNEIWYNREDGAVFFQVPPSNVFDSKRHAFRLATFDENLANLERANELLVRANPTVKVIVTVSPVPLRATFREDADAVTATFESKAVLLSATKAFVRRASNVYYFPSYEITCATLPDPFDADSRHVRRETVQRIMEIFDYQFIK